MGNPFEPYPHHPKAPSPANARLPVQRLKAAGAPPAVVDEAERRWAGASAEERHQAREAFDALTDDELRSEMATMETGLALSSVLGQEGDVDAELVEGAATLVPEAGENASTVDAANDWVGEDRTRALAMLAAERRRADTEQRKTLIDPLEAMVRGDQRH